MLDNRHDVLNALRQVHDKTKRLTLATAMTMQTSCVSSLPFHWEREGYYVWLANVTETIRHLRCTPTAIVMLLEQGHGQQKLQLAWVGKLNAVVYQSSEYQKVWNNMQKQNTGIHETDLVNSTLCCLTPSNGRLIGSDGRSMALWAADLAAALLPNEQKPIASAIG